MFTTDIYVQVVCDRVNARNVAARNGVEQRPSKPFSHPRALVGNFVEAQATITAAVKAVRTSALPKLVRIVIHPMELVEGGLTQVEERVLRELAVGSGASKVVVWVGEALSDEAVQSKLRGE